MTDPIRHHDPLPEGCAFVLNRQCAMCEHACLEHEWHCACCGQIDHDAHNLHCSGARSRNRIYGPLLPPHVPAHVWLMLERVAAAGFIGAMVDDALAPPPEGAPRR